MGYSIITSEIAIKCTSQVLRQMRNALNFTYSIYEVEDGSFGSMDQNGNWNGLIGALVSGSADIALAPLSVTAERENDVDFTVPYYDLVGTTILMKKPDMEYSLFKFMKNGLFGYA
ncbi:hypothetical protein ANCCAN_14918 [Ancylostoma caninum]|uniref:Ionotropic glutamate receptor L-glutamate and glycine-binding domain-containing protein n=1 Tax=Ancylostoma caninum TaxID=29170 RepID=A0A368G492_ANCCA|nr:hypothetical protein ANCCAN_14918 [Ancylostoma caninum]